MIAKEDFEDPLQWLMHCCVQIKEWCRGRRSANVHRDVKDGVRSEDLLSRPDIASEMFYMCAQ